MSSVGPLKIALYQLNGAIRDGKRGPLLIFTTTLPEGALVVGAGFVPNDDSANSDVAILASINSLERRAVPPPPAPAVGDAAAPASSDGGASDAGAASEPPKGGASP
jgi:hypothetical protein